VSDEDWVYNYFNYFTEIEEHFQRARGTSLFLLSTLDWALIENWKNAGVPLEAVMRGIDAAFEKWRARKVKTQMVNSLAFCAQAVLTEAQIMAGTAQPRRQAPPPIAEDALRTYLAENSKTVRAVEGYSEIAAALERLSDEAHTDLEALEQRQSDEDLLTVRREMDCQLRPYRGKMTADQLSMLEKQYLERALLEKAGLPRLSLFYMR
jgi:hypothetical protein